MTNEIDAEHVLPCDFVVGHIRFGKGVKLETVRRSGERWLTSAQENEKVLAALREAEFFFSEDFPAGPDGESCATPRYRNAYKAILAALAPKEGNKR